MAWEGAAPGGIGRGQGWGTSGPAWPLRELPVRPLPSRIATAPLCHSSLPPAGYLATFFKVRGPTRACHPAIMGDFKDCGESPSNRSALLPSSQLQRPPPSEATNPHGHSLHLFWHYWGPPHHLHLKRLTSPQLLLLFISNTQFRKPGARGLRLSLPQPALPLLRPSPADPSEPCPRVTFCRRLRGS